MNMLEKLQPRLPAIGIVAFSACSVNSLANLFLGSAEHPTPMLWVASALVELTTAWVVYQVVENARKVTKSNISRQDRRFYSLVLGAFLLLALPPLGLSVYANALEFGSVWMGIVFPLLSVACAVGYAMPDAVGRFEQRKATDRQEAESKRRERAKAKQKAAEAEAEQRRIEAEIRQKEAEAEAEKRRILSKMGKSTPVFALIEAEPTLTHDEIAQKLGISRQTVGYHISKLEALGALGSNGSGVES